MTSKVRQGMIEPGLATLDDVTALRSLLVGTVHEFPFQPSDPWWVPCYGQTLNVADYPLLASRIGTTYGGDGTTTFKLPDRRGRVAAGVDNMGGVSANRLTGQTGGLNGDTLGATGGAETHTLTTGQMPQHNHTAGVTINSAGNHNHDVARGGTGGGNYVQTGSSATSGSVSTSTDGAHTHTGTVTVNNNGSGQAHNNVQPTIAQYFCILAF